jgi:hypothetical protein
MAYDPSEFDCIDEHIPEYNDYLEEVEDVPPLTDEELDELAALECDCIIVEPELDDLSELNFDNS